jgi:Ca-activated chloride channel family protein
VWQQFLEGKAPDAIAGDWALHLEGCRACQTIVEELTGGNRTWLHIADELRQETPAVPAVCRRAIEEFKRGALAPQAKRPRMTACIHIERMMHRSSIAVPGESAAAYTLLKLIPSGLAEAALGLNLVLALDVSGSMYEEDGTGVSRLQRVQDAATAAIGKLRPQDTLSLVAFAHNALVLLPPTPIADKARIEDVLHRVDRSDVDPGGTAMDEGLALALKTVAPHNGTRKLSQVVILTDGETSGETHCRDLARQAAEDRTQLTFMGVGLDWKASLIKDLANLSQGKWYYIDVNEAQETTRIFTEEFETLAATAFLDVELRLRPLKDVRLKRLRQVVPEIKELKLEESAERDFTAQLGTLQKDVSSRYILDMSLPKRPDGKYAVAQLELTYDLGTGRRESSGLIPLEMTYTVAGQGYVNAEVIKHIDDIQFKELGDKLEIALENNDQEAAVQLAQEMNKKGELMGERAARKTQVVKQVLDELNTDRSVARKTQMVLGDVARLPEVPS